MTKSSMKEKQKSDHPKRLNMVKSRPSTDSPTNRCDSHRNGATRETPVAKTSKRSRTKSVTRSKSQQNTIHNSSPTNSLLFPVPVQTQQSFEQQQQQLYHLYPVLTPYQSDLDKNNSRMDRLSRESEAAMGNMSISSQLIDRNWNFLFPRMDRLQNGAAADKTESAQSQPTPATSKQPEKNDKKLQNGNKKPGDNSQEIKPKFSYKDQSLVEIKVVFLRVYNIDTLRQYFEAEVYIQARWTESQFAGYSEKQLDEVQFSDCWDPMLTIINVMGPLDSDKASMLLQYEPERVYPMLTYMWHIQGTFREAMELQHFPFDVQEISIVISSERTVREIELVCDYSQISNVSPRAMQGNQEWTPYGHVEFTRDFNTLEFLSTEKHPVLVAQAHVKRKTGFYFWNVILIVILILAMSFTVLGLEAKGGGRLLAMSTLFLACIAFKLVVKETLPNVAYLTYLDMYVIFALVFLALQGVENSIMLHLLKFRSPSKVGLYDEIAQFCLITIFIAFHLAFIIYIQVTAFSRRRSMSDKELYFEVAKINQSKQKQDKLEKEKHIGVENPLFKQTQTSDSLLSSLKDRIGPIEVNNPLFKKT